MSEPAGALLSAAWDVSPSGLCLLRAKDLAFLYCNAAYRRLAGLPAEVALRCRPPAEIVGTAALALLPDALRDGQPRRTAAHAGGHGDGRSTRVDWTVQPLPGPAGDVRAVAIFAVEAGAAPTAPPPPQVAERDARWVFAAGRCTHVSPAGARLAGKASDGLLGKTLAELARAYRFRDPDGGPLRLRPPAGAAAEFEVRVVRPDRTTAVLAVTATPAPPAPRGDGPPPGDAAGRSAGPDGAGARQGGGGPAPGSDWGDMIYEARDATTAWEARRALVAALRESRRRAERWEAIVQHIPVGVQVWDAEGRLRTQNRRAAEMLDGERPDRMAAMVRTAVGGAAEAGRAGGAAVFQRDTAVVRPDGTRRHLIVSSTPVCGEDGRVEEVLTVLDDVTEHRRLERAKDEFLALVAHELRNPLAALQVSAEAARRLLAPLDEEARAVPAAAGTPAGVDVSRLRRARQHLGRAVGQAQRMGALLAALLDAARLGTVRPVLERRAVDLVEICRTVASQCATTRGRDCVYVGPAVALPLRADPERLTQVIAHLVNNACKYSARGTHVEIGVRRDAAEARVDVRDRGIGVPRGEEQRIFDGFYRAANVRGPDGPPGLGIGLHVSRTLVAEHGGRIGCAPNPGGGSVFYFTLPVKEAPQ